jgi:hypothetical protein
MKRMAILSVLLLALVALSCGEIPTAAVPGANATPVPSTVPATPVPQAATWPAKAQPVIDLAIADLARQVSATNIEVVKVEAVQWRDGCLECAKQGEGCTEAIVPGYRVVLRVGGQEYEYRTDQKQTVRLCPAQTGAVGWGDAQPLVSKAVADLMTRLAVPATAVTVVSVEKKQWPDSSIGCPKPGQAYLTVIVPGYQIILEVNGKKFDYHAADSGDVLLCENQTQ